MGGLRAMLVLGAMACGGARTPSPAAVENDRADRGSVPSWWCYESVFGVQCPGTDAECERETADAELPCFEVRDVWCLRFDDEDGATPEHCSGNLESCRGYERFLAAFDGGLPIVQHCAAGSLDGP